MRWSRGKVGAVLVCLMLLAGECAWADPFGPGPWRFLEGVSIVFVLEPLVVLAEALAYTKFAGLRFLRALGTSFVANAASYLAGVLFWFAVSPSPLSGSLAGREARWVLVIALALVVEVPIVVGINRRTVDYKQLRTCAIYANCASCIFVWVLVDIHQGIFATLVLLVAVIVATALLASARASAPGQEALSGARDGKATAPTDETDLTWRCPCGEVNVGMASVCRSCERPRALDDDAE